MVQFIRSDLEFILAQIAIAEQHAAGDDLRALLPNSEVAFGLRTVDGSLNNLVPGQSEFGAADTIFPRLTDPVFRTAESGTSYAQASGLVFDSQPRTISNLIVDQTANNPAAYATAYDPGLDGLLGTTDDVLKDGVEVVTSPGLDGVFGTADDTEVFFIPNIAPDEGLSAGFNAWMTFFGQFFDHGLDLVTKGGSGTVFIPLQPDDPLFVPGSPTNFMVLTRATNLPGADGILGTADDIHEHENTTSPFVDQNQTYSSHPSHQVFLRAYEFNAAGDPVATGRLITNRNLGADGEFGTADDVEIGGMATWAVVKAQARDLLGINLTDADFDNVPLLATDAYGNFIKGPTGFPQVVMVGPDGLPGTSDDVLVEGNPAAPVDLTNAVRTGHAFLNDIAHSAVPVFVGGVLAPDSDNAVGLSEPGTYDNELLDAHYMAGDGRVNENIGLTTVHAIFHSEHNRLVQHTQDVVLATNDLAFLSEWLVEGTAPATFPTTQAEIDALQWNGERLFQSAKFGTEMQYQHLVFEEFARTIQPQIDAFLDFDDTINPSIVAEFAHTVYRFGHSMLTETIDRLDPEFQNSEIGLIAAFLNPLAFAASGPTPEEAAGAIVRGTTRQLGNEIDEFVTEALRNNLLGLPLDLATINLARGRDAGIPSLNAARREFYEGTGDSQLRPYTSWSDLVQHLKHPESLVNFIAAYGTHSSITSATTLDGKRAAAMAIVLGGDGAPADRLDFLNSTGVWANGADGVTITGLDNVDLWIGGLAEEKMPFGGMLGSTFNFVFETQLERLQDGDRLYYLHRTAGLNFLAELENNSFAKMIMANTDVTHLPALVFSTPGFTFEVDPTKQFTGLDEPGADGIQGTADDEVGLDGIQSNSDPIGDSLLTPLVIRDNPATPGSDANYLQYTGDEHVVLGGTAGDDILISSIGDDTVYGDGGNDRIEGGDGNDDLQGGDGDDIITDKGGDDVIKGGAGNDVIQGGNGINLVIAGPGSDFIITGEDITEVIAGTGNDFILGSRFNVQMAGNEGDDWIEIGSQDGAPGDNFDPFGTDSIIGNDVFLGDGGFDEMIGEGGDDVFVGSAGPDKLKGMSGFDWATYKDMRFGVAIDFFANAFNETPVPLSIASTTSKFAGVEGLSGSAFGDVLLGDDSDAAAIATQGAQGSVLTNIGLIDGLQDFLGAGVTSFGSGNIILGGNGSDIIEGRGGDDLIDGDAWLDVYISVRANADGTGAEIRRAESLTELVADMVAGNINPGQLQVVREILPGSGGFNFDTAVFSGNMADYTIAINDGGTPLNFTDDIVTVTDNVVGRDGLDRLTHIERLQFADQTFVLANGLNSDPSGLLTILDAASNTPDNTPASGQLLRVSPAGVTDADNVGPNNPTGAVTGAITYHWQVEVVAGSGVFEDIGTLGGAGVASAIGPTFRVTPDLQGLNLRVKAIYQDANGVLETVFSGATASVAAGVAAPPAAPLPAESGTSSAGIHLIRSDLQFILDQIVIAEHHAAGEDLLSLLPNSRVPFGLRTVDGSLNNLVPGQSEFGAADTIFPRLTDPVFRTAESGTSYAQASGLVFDSQPRTISNLIVDQTANNPAAYATAYDPGLDGLLGTTDDVLKDGVEVVTSPGLDGVFGTADDTEVFFIPNIAPDEGLSAGFNAWMTFFGQFFDHGLDLVTKGGSGTVFIPLQPDDPLFVPGSPTNFMVLTRATNLPGADGILGTADDIHEHENTTSPFVDQNQTYSSHPSHQVFLRAYEFNAAGDPVATGRLITNRNLGADGEFGTADDVEIGGMATWAVVKAQARDLLGINLTDADFDNVPLLATDAYGNFIKGPTGFPQVVMVGPDGLPGTSDDVLVEGNPAAPVDLTNAVRTGHAFLNDIAHSAVPVFVGGVLAPDSDNAVGLSEPGTYDNELLDAHYMAGDGRVNENIGLTTVHAIFHSEHNRLVQHTQDVVLATNDLAFLSEWLVEGTAPATFPTTQAEIDALQWNGERLFQSAKFGTEMQYQHLVFEEFARTIQPQIDVFIGPTQGYDANIDPSIVAEFAHTVYRFGHSMLTETIDRLDPNFQNSEIGLIAAFLNPLAFAASGPTPEEAAGAIVRGTTRQLGNEIDEFVTEALRNNLLGLPLDLATINLARGRDAGIPSLNAARREFYEMTGDSQLKPYTSWADLVQHLKHPESLINFIAAYGTHSSITGATTLDGKRAAAMAIVLGGVGEPLDRLDFLNSTGAWASGADGVTTTGLDNVDLWIGGLAEEKMPFGGMLGSTFNFVFETQLEALQNGDRFYYLDRTAGLNFVTELENNSFAKMMMANTDATHLPGLVFQTPGLILEVDQARQFNGDLGNADPVGDSFPTPLVIRDNPGTIGPDLNYLQYTGDEHVVLGGTDGDDVLIASIGDDTIWGDGGNDRIEGGDGNDLIRAGTGDDIITDTGGDDNIQGDDGNDVIQAGNGVNLILGGFGKDFIITGEDSSEAFGGPGDDFILGANANEQDMGNEGDDWLEQGNLDGNPGDNFDPFGLDTIIGNDVYIGSGQTDIMNAEGGDDIMVGSSGPGDKYLGASGFDWATFKDDQFGVNVDLTLRAFDAAPLPASAAAILARFAEVEGLSGSAFSDILRGDDADAAVIATAGAQGSVLTNIGLIDGLQDFLGVGVTSFGSGNIILGGDGSDIIEGRGGADLIDGDAWLNVRISVRENLDGTGAEIATFDSMVPLIPFMLDGTYNPGQLQIVRELESVAGPDFDTAVFSGNLADYTIVIEDNGTLDFNDDIVTVTDNVGTNGTDRLTHIERLQFSDQSIVLGGLNNAPLGLLTILDAATNTPDNTPTEDQLLRVSIAGVTDADNPGDGSIAGPVAYVWQFEPRPGTGVFEDILVLAGGGVSRVTSTTFRPGDDLVGLALRVKAVYQDSNGVLEEVFSTPTAPVANVNDAPTGAPTLSDTTPTEGRALTVDTNTIVDSDGTTTAVTAGTFIFQWQQSADGAVWTDIAGATGQLFVPTQAQVGLMLRVVVTYTDDGGTTETVMSAATDVVGDLFLGGAAADAWIGTEGQDIASSGAGDDLLVALGGNDILDGGAGADTIIAGAGDDTITGRTGIDQLIGDAGNDTFTYTFGDGADAVNGGDDLDTLNILGTVANNTLDVIFDGTALTNFEGGTIAGVEAVTADLLTGIDTLTYAGTTAAVSVDLSAGTASGFTSIAGVENVTGGTGGDTLTGDGHANALLGGAGNDILNGGLGNDVLNGGAGIDTASFAGDIDDMFISLVAGTSRRGDALSAIEDTLVSIENVTGGSGDDTITSNGGSQTLDGGAGNDTLIGGAGNDVLIGGLGNDTFTYTFGNGADAVAGGAGTDALNITGTAAVNNVLDVIFDGAAVTNFEGGTIAGVESVTVDLLTGVDALTYAGTTTDVTANLATGSASGFTSIAGIENVTGGSGNDALTGAAGVTNTLTGGAGNDTFFVHDDNTDNLVNPITDTVSEANGVTGGIDEVRSFANAYTITDADVENLTFVGVGNFAGTGNASANVITGGVGIDALSGGGGADTLIGGAGNDVMNGGTGNDMFVFAAGFGNDIISGFDANPGPNPPALNQDLLDISAFAIDDALEFAARVDIDVLGANTLVTIDGTDTIMLLGVNGVGANVITQQDFLLV